MVEEFRFQQFSVRQSDDVMKVGTDALLLGGWASANQPRRILDVGTGCGVIALMLAQRYPEASIVGVDLNPTAVRLARSNFAGSMWSDRMEANCLAVQQLAAGQTFGLIVSNPPYFSEGLRSPVQNRRVARHDDLLTVAELATAAAQLLSPNGRFCLVAPPEYAEDFAETALEQDLHAVQRCDVRPKPGAAPNRCLIAFEKTTQAQPTADSFCLELSRHNYSPEYARLLQPFLLRYAD